MYDGTYQIKTRTFEGPLDLLLQLIEERKLHINDIALAQITDDYLAHIEESGSFPLTEAAHFILVASTLVLIKSRSLLPALALSDEEEGDIKDLERRLIEYKKIKELSAHIEKQYNAHIIFIPPQTSRVTPVFSPTKKITVDTLHQSIQRVLMVLPKINMIPQAFVKKMVSLEETITLLFERITKDMNVRFADLHGQGGEKNRSHIIVSFLAVLELVKRGMVLVSQRTHFSDIQISKL